MCVPHAQISYFPSPDVMDRMQNGGFGSVAFDRAFMSCVEETSSQRYKVEFKHTPRRVTAARHPFRGPWPGGAVTAA